MMADLTFQTELKFYYQATPNAKYERTLFKVDRTSVCDVLNKYYIKFAQKDLREPVSDLPLIEKPGPEMCTIFSNVLKYIINYGCLKIITNCVCRAAHLAYTQILIRYIGHTKIFAGWTLQGRFYVVRRRWRCRGQWQRIYMSTFLKELLYMHFVK